MKIRNLVIALVVLVLLGGGYYGSIAWKNRKVDSPVPVYEPPLRLGNLDEPVKIKVPGIVLIKNNDEWELSYPSIPGIKLDQSRIRSIAWSLASVVVNRMVEEAPTDLSLYGLDKPSAQAVLADASGSTAKYFLGSLAPSRNEYYIMEESDPNVYIVSSYTAESLMPSLDSIRQKTLFRSFEPNELTSLRLESPQALIDVRAKPEFLPVHLSCGLFSYILVSPYILARGVDSEALQTLIAPLGNLSISDFIDDNPSSLRPYGLDAPARISLRLGDETLDLLIGNQTEGKRYAKLAGALGVFTLSGMEPVLNTRAFSLTDKFALILNIDAVDRLEIRGGEKDLVAEFRGKGDDAVFTLNGKNAESKSFRTFYQSVIGLMFDAEYGVPAGIPRNSPAANSAGVITIEYRLNTPPGTQASLTLIPYTRDFYILSQEGTTEFLISVNQVRNIFETAEKVIF